MSEVNKKELKKELYKTLEKLIVLAQKEDLSNYMKLKREYNKIYSLVFDMNSDESFKWDLVRNKLDGIFTFKNYFLHKKISKVNYEENKKIYLKEAMEMLEELKGYLT